jgi:hypothetical protein
VQATRTAASFTRHLLGAVIEALLIIAIIVAVTLGLALVSRAGPAGANGVLAGRGGGHTTATSATLTLSPNPVAAWSSFRGSGCGYTVGKQVNISVSGPAWKAGLPVPVNGDGCMSFTFWVDGPGAYTVKAMQNLSGRKQTTLATEVLIAN